MSTGPQEWSQQQWLDWYDRHLPPKSTDLIDGAAGDDVGVALRSLMADDPPHDVREFFGFGAEARSQREAFLELSPELKQRVFDWVTNPEPPPPASEPEVDSIAGEISPPRPGGYTEADRVDEPGSAAGAQTPEVHRTDPSLSSGPELVESLEDPTSHDVPVEIDSAPISNPESGGQPDHAIDWGETDDGAFNVTLPNQNVARVTPTVGDPEIRVSNPDGSDLDRSADLDIEGVTGHVMDPGAGELAPSGCLPPIRRTFAAAFVAGAIAVIALAVANLGDGPTPTASDRSATTDAAAAGSPSLSTPTTTDAVPTTASAPADTNACGVPADHQMTLSSPTAFEGQLGPDWLRTNLRERGWSVPAFKIDNAPPGATELALVASELNERQLNDYVADPTGDPRPLHSFYVMLLTGIPPETSQLASFYGDNAPDGIEVQGDLILGETGNAFVSRDDDGYLLVTVVALCNPPEDYFDPMRTVWMEGRVADASMLLYVGPDPS